MNTPVPFLFVYGSLRSDVPGPEDVKQQLAQQVRKVGMGRTPGKLYRVKKWFPGLVSSACVADWVLGEVYEMLDPQAVFQLLDAFEGCLQDRPLFRRICRTVVLGSEEKIQAWMYVYARNFRYLKAIPGGDYAQHVQSRRSTAEGR